MYRTNSKEAIKGIRNYIMEESVFDSYEIEKPSTFSETASIIMHCFHDEKVIHDKRRMTYQELFEDWMQGLPSCSIGDYYYRVEAKPILKRILNETDTEADRYTEEEACKLLTYLIYRELCKVTNYPFITD